MGDFTFKSYNKGTKEIRVILYAKGIREGARVGRVLERPKMGKFVCWDVLDGRLSCNFDQDKIAAEKLFNGCYIVSGEVPNEKMAASEVVASYKKLGLVEEAFWILPDLGSKSQMLNARAVLLRC